jgi:hypothetical protein
MREDTEMTVAIRDESGEITTGTVRTARVGQTMEIEAKDENGMPFAVSGEVVEILEGDDEAE